MSQTTAFAAQRRRRQMEEAEKELQRKLQAEKELQIKQQYADRDWGEASAAPPNVQMKTGDILAPFASWLDEALRPDESSKIVSGVTGNEVHTPWNALRELAADWTTKPAREALEGASAGDQTLWTVQRSPGGDIEPTSFQLQPGALDVAFLGADLASLGSTKAARTLLKAGSELPGQFMKNMGEATTQGLPAISAPIGGRAQLGLLGRRLPKTPETIDKQLAEQGYTVGSAPGIYQHPEEVAQKPVSTRLTSEERAMLNQYQKDMTEEYGAPVAKQLAALAKDSIITYRGEHHPSKGWSPIGVKKVETNPDASAKANPVDVTYVQQHPQFHKDPNTGQTFRGVARSDAIEDVSNKMVAEVEEIIQKAGAGDRNAQFIVDQSKWYRQPEQIIKQLFGEELGTIYGDLQGAMSPNTRLSQQHQQAQEIMERWVKGELDEAMAKFDAHMAKKPKGVSDGTWAKELGDKKSKYFDPEAVIHKKSGKLYNINSINAQLALRGKLRQLGPGMAPKMRNFAANLLGLSTDPTIDVWAGRTINRLMGGARVPPQLDAGVPGIVSANPEAPMLSKDHYERALSYKRRSDKAIEKGREPPEPSEKYLEDMEKTPSPYITGQYGLASDIYKTAAAKLGMDADDLQALMWFLEKEKWERAGWTPIDKNPSLIDLMKRDNPPEKADDIRKFAIERGLTK